MATRYVLPYFLEDKTGRLDGSEFVDLHDRIHLVYKRKSRDASRIVYELYDITMNTFEAFHVPVVTLCFGADHSLGSVCFAPGSAGGGEQWMHMGQYLSQVNSIAGSRLRRFFASDGNEYRWGYRLAEGNEWTCTNSSGTIVSHYNLKSPGEPTYPGSSGCMLTVEEDYGHLACEMLATVMIMRHIVEYDIS
ncbi:hypothetical protein JR316_0001608 [Psilocybe cubensis]|uniref:Uncharacterized protein n=2 Tax=Psilocybe cubensis TaxID=181762 RepID=A0ACB8HA66_PSICU|nr:hypothetical protein JR316_0001608 [Psilocybe cubensis]KAH9484708.1 hypothetical protein JR316_0001608 [Psilocybe cubensis]